VPSIVRKKRCPTCGGIDFTRRRRYFWMRWISGSQYFICRHCRTRVLWLSGKTGDQGESLADG